MLTGRALVRTAIGDVAAGGITVEIVWVKPRTACMNTKVQVGTFGISSISHLSDLSILIDDITDFDCNRTLLEVCILGRVVVAAITIHVVTDVHVTTPCIGITFGEGGVATHIAHRTGGSRVDAVALIAVEVEAIMGAGNITARAVVPGTAVDLDIVVVDRQNEGTVGQGLGDGQEEAQEHEKENEQGLAHGSFL